MRKQSRHNRIAVLFALALLGFSSTALAQQFTLNRYRAAEKVDDGFAISRPNSQGHFRLGVALHLDYANDPLVLEGTQGAQSTELLQIVKNQLAGHLALSLGLWDRAVLTVGLNGNFVMDGPQTGAVTRPDGSTVVLSADGATLGDATVGLRLRLLGDNNSAFSVAVQGTLGLPTAKALDDEMQLAGEAGLWGHPELLLELRTSILRFTLNGGAFIRSDQNVPTTSQTAELTFGAGVTVPMTFGKYDVDLHAEGFGYSSFDDFGDRESAPFEVLGGLKLYRGNWALGVASGVGIFRGVGSPDYRGVLLLGWQKRGHAGGPGDSDGDGILDADDDCPEKPEDKDSFKDEDGCPDIDNDEDNVLDVDDGAPLQPEDVDGFEDEDGVPDPDNDQDGVMDDADKCPNEAGVVENRGCPDSDRDGDGVVDRLDNCPDEPGKKANQGCKKKQKVVIRDGSLEILDKVYFRTNKDVIRPKSFGLLTNVATVLKNHPEIEKVQVEGHTDARGKRNHNLDLSKRRAASVVRFLVNKGLDSGRLEAVGYGPDRPVVKNASSKEQHAQNRRVEFKLIGGGDGIEQN